MNYKEALFFIGKCLTLNSEKQNFEIVKHQLEKHSVDWDNIVKISTSHYVFPALFCSLKRAKLLQFLPTDLVEYMEIITQLNGQRNRDILKQVNEINTLLIQNNITPIFLKGAGNIAEKLYEDIAERMIADIDFVVHKKEYLKAVSIIKSAGYSKVDQFKHHSPSYIHHPRLQKEGCVAAVEIHKQVVIEKFSDEFNYDVIKDKCITKNGIKVLSYDNQLSLSILANQINDGGFYFRNLTLKHAYDVYLLSKETNAKKAFDKFNRLKFPLNCFLGSCFQVFNQIDSLEYHSNTDTEKYLADFNAYLVDDAKRKRDYLFIRFKLYLIQKSDFIAKTLFDKEYRNWFINDFLIRLRLKKLAY